MKHRAIFIGILLSIVFVFISYAQQVDLQVLKGPYLGQKPPGIMPEVFVHGVVNKYIRRGSDLFWVDAKILEQLQKE